MAITTQAQYRGHILAALKFAIQERPRRFLELVPGLVAYVQAGGTAGERADRREVLEMLVTAVWAALKGGNFDGHEAVHLLLEAGVPPGVLTNLVQRAEP
jgi:hypothetical protein